MRLVLIRSSRRAGLTILREELGGARAAPADVTNRGDIRRIVAATVERHGRINALVNNAGASLH
jgi:NAD(P)-dependent dehydrogenase (short-subunit alcohol dehydrogenase family)